MGTIPPGSTETADFDLHSFFPYLVRIYYRAVSSSITDIYASRYGLSVSEWRTWQSSEPIGSPPPTSLLGPA